MLKAEVLHSLTELFAYHSKWEHLVKGMPYPTPFAHPDWIITALRVNNNIVKPYIFIIKEKNEVVALLPLGLFKHQRTINELRFIGDSYYPDPLGICCKQDKRLESIELIIKHLQYNKEWDRLNLKFFLEKDAFDWSARGAEIHRLAVEPFLLLPPTFSEFLNQFPRKKRYNLNAAVRKFENADGSYRSAGNGCEGKKLLKILFNLHEKRSAEKGISSTFSGETIFNFHNSLCNCMDEVIYRALELNGETVAVLYGFMFQKRFFFYQIAHDPAFHYLSPGSVLLYNVIKECCEAGIREFNFLQGDYGYKSIWAKDKRDLYSIMLYNNTLGGYYSRQKDKTKDIIKSFFSSYTYLTKHKYRKKYYRIYRHII